MWGRAPAFEVTGNALREEFAKSHILPLSALAVLSAASHGSFSLARPCYYLSFSYFGFSIFGIKYVRHKNRLENNLEKAHVTASQMTHRSPTLMALRSKPLPSFLPLTGCSLFPCVSSHFYNICMNPDRASVLLNI